MENFGSSTSEDPIKHCGFCFKLVDVGPSGDGFRIRLTKDGSPSRQVLYAHGTCLVEHLHPRAGFRLDTFED